MRYIIALLSLVTVLSAATPRQTLSGNIPVHLFHATLETSEDVYLCKSSTAYVYHQVQDCRGLNACTHKIIKVSKREAVSEYRRRACKVCY